VSEGRPDFTAPEGVPTFGPPEPSAPTQADAALPAYRVVRKQPAADASQAATAGPKPVSEKLALYHARWSNLSLGFGVGNYIVHVVLGMVIAKLNPMTKATATIVLVIAGLGCLTLLGLTMRYGVGALRITRQEPRLTKVKPIAALLMGGAIGTYVLTGVMQSLILVFQAS
jgi:hypothetical protein